MDRGNPIKEKFRVKGFGRRSLGAMGTWIEWRGKIARPDEQGQGELPVNSEDRYNEISRRLCFYVLRTVGFGTN